MKWILVLSLIAMLCVTGCQQPSSSQPSQPPKIHVEVNPQVPPTPPQVQPPVPPVPTRNYVFGYYDGYHNRILAVRWAVWEYRQGWELGRWDRVHNLQPRFTP